MKSPPYLEWSFGNETDTVVGVDPADEPDRSAWAVCAEIESRDTPVNIEREMAELHSQVENLARSRGIQHYDIGLFTRDDGSESGTVRIVGQLVPRPIRVDIPQRVVESCECSCRGSARTLQWTPRDLPGYPVSAGLPGHTSADSARWTPPEDNDSTDRDIDDLLSDISQLLREETELSDESGKQGKHK